MFVPTLIVAALLIVDVFLLLHALNFWLKSYVMAFLQRTCRRGISRNANLLNVCSHLDCGSLAHWDALGGALRRETMLLWDTGGRSEGFY